MSEESTARPPLVYVPDLAVQMEGSEEILLRKEEREHARSRRLRDGDEVVALDGKGARAAAQIVRHGTAIALLPSKKIFSSSSSSAARLPGEPRNRVVVALACAEPARIEWAIEKGTECGAAGFVLLACERSQRSHVSALSSPARLARLQRIAVEATKQCDRTLVPFVEGPKRAEEFLRKVRGETLVVMDPAAREGARPAAGAVTLAVGPEGGFAPSELSLFKEKSPVFFSLGTRILRLETAVVAALVRLVEEA